MINFTKIQHGGFVLTGESSDDVDQIREYLSSQFGYEFQKAKTKRRKSRGSSSARKRRKKVVESDSICVYCGFRKSNTADHIIPKSRGGSDSYLNLVGCCEECNSAKADMTPKEAGMKMRLPARFFSYLDK